MLQTASRGIRSGTMIGLVFAVASAGCSSRARDESGVSAAALEVSTTELWAGLPSYTIERYTTDLCDDGAHRLDTTPIDYEEWARERAGIRNVCFEVWKPGVTDTENPDFWRYLDVQVHYRFVGTSEWTVDYVNQLDRRFNNRRYAWGLGFQLDPFAMSPVVGDVTVPFTIVDETAGQAEVAANLEFYFTVNGEVLNSSQNTPFSVHYVGAIQKPTLDSSAKHVLNPTIRCADSSGAPTVVIGGGAGYFAADITAPDALAAFGASPQGNFIYSAPVSTFGTPVSSMAVTFSASRVVMGQAFEAYVEGESSAAGPHAQIVPSGSSMTLSIRAYDRVQKAPVTLSHTFDGCVAASP